MRVFLISFPLIEAARELVRRGVEIVYWTRAPIGFDEAQSDQKNFPHTIFHNSYDALAGRPADGVRVEDLAPAPKDIFDSLEPITWQVLAMISRADYAGLSFAQKTALYQNYVNYWYGVIRKYAPRAVIFADIPHTGCNYVIYALAKLLGVKTIIYRRVKGFTDRILMFDDWRDYRRLREQYQTLASTPVSLSDLDPTLQAYYQKQSSAHQDLYSQEITAFLKQGYKYSATAPSPQKIIKHLANFSFWPTAFRYVRMLLHRRQIADVSGQSFYGWQLKWLFHQGNKIKARYRQEYRRWQKAPNLSAPFIYLPLHFQPECNTNPLGGIFDNQLLLVQCLAAGLPAGWSIYVKENPMQWTHYQGQLGRYPGYYAQLANIAGVTLAPVEMSTYNLIDKAQAVATITGSAGWEAVLRGKPAFVFGQAWYKDCEGVFPVGDVAAVRQALEQIKAGYKVNQQKVLAFLKALETVSIKAYPDKRYQQFSQAESRANARAIAAAIYHELLSV